jgi:hypothetical protein
MSCGTFWSSRHRSRTSRVKKAQAVQATRQRETEAALDLIRRQVQGGDLSLAWIERTLRDASLRDTARLLEGFLNHELPQLLDQRAKLSGMRWSCDGAENIMAFRCLIKSNLFDDYCRSKRQAA